MTKQEKIIAKGVALMLYETERTIAERGYTGIVKYLYSGYAEFKMLMLLPSEIFAAMHEYIISEAQLQKRITRTKILKNAIAAFTAASVITVGVFMPTINFGYKFIALLVVAAGSVGFFGIMLHALNNFIEEMKIRKITGPFTLTFTPFTLHEVKDMINKTKEGDIETQKQYIKKLLDYKDELVLLFEDSKKFSDGSDLRRQTQILIENLSAHLLKIGHKNESEQLNDIVYSLRKNISSLPLMGLIVAYADRQGLDDKKREMLEFFFNLIDVLLKQESDLPKYGRLIFLQENIARILLVDIEDDSDRQTELVNGLLFSKKYSSVSIQIFIRQYIEVMCEVPEEYLKNVLQSLGYESLISSYTSMSFLNNLTYKEINKEIGSLFVKTAVTVKQIYRIIEDRSLAIEHRLYALYFLSRTSIGSSALRAMALRDITTSENYNKSIIDKDMSADLIKESRAYLQEFAKRKIEKKDDLLNAVQFETVYTAMAIIEHDGREDVDIIDVLRQMKYVFGNKQNINILYDDEKKVISDSYTIPVGNTKKYLDTIKKIVTKDKSQP